MAERASTVTGRPAVAITRSVEDNRSLAAGLERLGFVVVAVPLIDVAAPGDGGRALAEALERLADYDWVVLTSANGVRAVVDAGIGRSWPEGVAVAAVGPATAAAARSAGLPVALVPDVATASALVDAFPVAGPPPPGRLVLAPLAHLASDTVVTGLGAKGWLVDRVEAYRTVAPTGRAHRGAVDVDAVAFFSPSAVDRWVDRYGTGVPLAVCVGPSTSARARDRGLAEVVEATPHDQGGVVRALEDRFGPSR